MPAAPLRSRLIAALAACAGLWPAAAAAEVQGTACPGPGAAEILLAPEALAGLDAAPPGAITVTGAYTAAAPDLRADGHPRPVGLFIHRGRSVTPDLARMDGLLIVAADGTARIVTTAAAPMGGALHDLRRLSERRAFARAAAELGASVLQSHLLIRDGRLDLRPVEGAPRAPRRLLLADADGRLSLWRARRPVTLHEAAVEALAAQAPTMALNLDTGSFDFCVRMGPAGPAPCGLLMREGAARLSNLLRLHARPVCARDAG